MTDIPRLSGPSFGPTAGGEATQLVILLHGLGADGNDLIGLAPFFAQVLPQARFVSPNAPFECDMMPPGFRSGYQWFSLQERTPETLLAGARVAHPILDAYIDQQIAESGIEPAGVALVGFSQGTMMSLFAGLRRAGQLAGILGYSGRLVGPEELAAEIASRPPVTLINGDRDELIPVEVQPEAVAALEANGVPVKAHIRPGLGHSIDEAGIEIGCEFLARVLG